MSELALAELPDAVLAPAPWQPHPADAALVRALFDPHWYAAAAGLDAGWNAEALFGDYLARGVALDLAPGPLFDPEMARQVCGLGAPGPGDHVPAMIGWLQRRRPETAPPTDLFDVAWYRAAYGDLTGATFDLFEHYVLHGMRENRAPHALFEPGWYAQAYAVEAGETPDYRHFLGVGLARGHAPSAVMLATFHDGAGHDGAGGVGALARFRAILAAARGWSERLSPELFAAALAFFMPQFYDDGGRSGTGGHAGKLIDFLTHGLAAGASPGPLFDGAVWRAQAGGDGAAASFLDYLRDGWGRRIVPNALFVEAGYLADNADIRAAGVWSFAHFLRHGIFEGRRMRGLRKLTIAPDGPHRADSDFNNWRIFWLASLPDAGQTFGLPPIVAQQQARLAAFTGSPLFAEIVTRARAIDPSLGDTHAVDGYFAPPWHDPAHGRLRRLNARIPAGDYGTIITVPWLRVGGADLVACQLAAAVRRARPGERVLLLRLDWPQFDRPDWVPAGVEVAHLSDILAEVPGAAGERLLYALFMALAPARIINVNSALAWRVIERFGKRLGARMRIYGYLFCWDQTDDGRRVGYPSMVYSACAAQIAGIFTDTDYLRDELLKIYRPPPQVAQRTRALYTPARSQPTALALAEDSFLRRRARRPRILWAGRLDRQKRFDLVQQIAAAMPEADFLCWGDAVLDAPPDHALSPPNLVLNGGFKSYDELPFAEADLWLFTSAWEGMPTILIEIAMRGMAVVASQVGGIPELIDEATGWPVRAVEDVDAYVAALRAALAGPVLRIARARRLQARVAERYGEGQYVAALGAIFDAEDGDAGGDSGS